MSKLTHHTDGAGDETNKESHENDKKTELDAEADSTDEDADADAETDDTEHLAGLSDGAGCTEVWEHLSAQREDSL
ncbi:hypothetical protein HUB97_02125 [Halorubraceae archaeon YAN]|nr:hypothetical protein [Halorubraceae archaeon YAN]